MDSKSQIPNPHYINLSYLLFFYLTFFYLIFLFNFHYQLEKN